MIKSKIKLFSKLSSVLLFLVMTSNSAQAAVFTYTDTYYQSAIGDTNFFSNESGYIETLSNSPFSNIPQFSTTLGTLESVKFTLSGGVGYLADMRGLGVLDSNLGNSALASFQLGIRIATSINGTTTLTNVIEHSGFASCSTGPGPDGCVSYSDGPFNFDTSETFTGTDMNDFIGMGALGHTSLQLFAGLNSNMYLDNIIDAELSTLLLFDGDVTVEYTTSAVPVPAAIWFFGSALAGLGFTRRRKS